jgi:excisionase family DNA binding protein
VAERLGVSQATVVRAIARGLLQPASTTPGGHRRFRPEDIDAIALAHAAGKRGNGRLISTGDAARLLGVSQHTVIRAVHHGRLLPDEITPGGHYRFAVQNILGGLRQNDPHIAAENKAAG